MSEGRDVDFPSHRIFSNDLNPSTRTLDLVLTHPLEIFLGFKGKARPNIKADILTKMNNLVCKRK
jgi:hypothetical protein